MRFIVCFFLIGWLGSCKGQPKKAVILPVNKDDNSLLWEITSKDLKAPSYLFGTFHLMCSSDIRFSENLKTALAASDEVYFEMDLDNMSEMLSAIFLMNMKNGKTLKDLYDSASYVRIQRFFADSLSRPFAALQKMKPAFLESMLYTKMLPCKSVSGVEEELLKIATANKKEVRGFETMAFQASVFDSIPYDLQANSLLRSIDSLQDGRVKFKQMVDTYKTQRLDSLEKLMREEDGLEVMNEELLLNGRNRNWVAQLKTILQAKSVFISVGAGHLVGKSGLIALLRKEGYSLRPIVNQ